MHCVTILCTYPPAGLLALRKRQRITLKQGYRRQVCHCAELALGAQRMYVHVSLRREGPLRTYRQTRLSSTPCLLERSCLRRLLHHANKCRGPPLSRCRTVLMLVHFSRRTRILHSSCERRGSHHSTSQISACFARQEARSTCGFRHLQMHVVTLSRRLDQTNSNRTSTAIAES